MGAESISLNSGSSRKLAMVMAGASFDYFAFEDALVEESDGMFPHPNFNQGANAVSFVSLDDRGRNILSRSRSFAETTIPAREIKRLRRCLEHLHEKACATDARSDLKAFFRDFMVPSPKLMPEAYRVVGRFRKRLYVYWGYENCPKGAVLPLTVRAKQEAVRGHSEWNIAERVPLRFFDWRKVLRGIVYAIVTLGLAAYFCLLIPVRCCHGEITGHGIGGRFMQRTCPYVCPLEGCHRHLEKDLCCPVCCCKVCGKKRKLNVDGECVEPPDEERCTATVGSENARRCNRHCKPSDSPSGERLCPRCERIRM